MTLLKGLYTKLDEHGKAFAQNSYLWILDRTGAYVATIQMAMYLLSAAFLTIKYGYLPVWVVIFLAILGFFMGTKYLLQDKGKNDAINAGAMVYEASRFRHFANFYFTTMIVLDLVLRGGVWDVGFDLILLLIGFVETIKVRDRDKKPFFEKKEQLALEGA